MGSSQILVDYPELRETPFEELFHAMDEEGEAFDCRGPVGPGEDPLGKMNRLEKAAEFKLERYSELWQAAKREMRELHISGIYPFQVILTLEIYQHKCNFFAEVLWNSFYTRFAQYLTEGRTFGIRADNTIVLCDCPSEATK